ncbi:MAG: 2-C-methyl-D-erythritol 4-phosphate cytidylyltransferase [Gemmatimonadota bacterium]|nr:2-C-methyl-D-erythritol 4-phosphate cytidylyltransferase [Gemmatimonadota bacterium]
MTTAVIVAGGTGERLPGEVPKQLRDLGGLPILEWSVRVFERHPDIEDVVVVLPATLAAAPPVWLAGRARVVAGGATRVESVRRGALAAIEATTLLIHDAVRPFASPDLIGRIVAAARRGPAIPAVPVADTIKRVDASGVVVETPDRSSLRAAQTPQGFPAALLRELLDGMSASAEITDEGVLCELAGLEVRTVPGELSNLKITDAGDLAYARWLVESGVIAAPSLT